MEFTVVSFYKFIPFTSDSLESLIKNLRSKAEDLGIKGLVISALEGLNGTIAGTEEGVQKFIEYLGEYSKGDWKLKYSVSPIKPFKRFTIRYRKEIVTSGKLDLEMPNAEDNSHVSPEEWHRILSSEEDIAIIDVRNDYEVEVGKFKGAIDPLTKDFKEFPKFVEESGIPKDKQVLMYCTGGIRCEKASLVMKEMGYSNIKQLDGGILRYMEKFPRGFFEGECFVFDDRVALNDELKPTTKFGLCPHCGDGASDYLDCKNCGAKKKVCARCQKIEARKTCSKNCRYHYSLRLERNMGIKGSMAKVILVTFIFISGFVNRASAEVISPEDTVKAVIKEIKTKGDPSPVVDHVSWDDGFSKLPVKNREAMGVKSPEELKEFYRRVLLSPSSEIERMFESKFKDKLDGLGPEKVKALLSNIKERALQKEAEIKKRLKESEYEVGKAQVQGENASVPLTTTYEGQKNSDNVKLVQKDGKWYFASLGSGFNMGELSHSSPPKTEPQVAPKKN